MRRFSESIYIVDDIWEEGEMPQEVSEEDDMKYKSHSKFPFHEVTSGNCREINNRYINMEICTLNQMGRIEFNIEGSIKEPHFAMLENAIKNPNIILKSENLLDEELEFTVALSVLMFVICNIDEFINMDRSRDRIIEKLQFVIDLFKLFLKNS
jgi:hypothetical protein